MKNKVFCPNWECNPGQGPICYLLSYHFILILLYNVFSRSQFEFQILIVNKVRVILKLSGGSRESVNRSPQETLSQRLSIGQFLQNSSQLLCHADKKITSPLLVNVSTTGHSLTCTVLPCFKSGGWNPKYFLTGGCWLVSLTLSHLSWKLLIPYFHASNTFL